MGGIHSGFNNRIEPTADEAECLNFIESRVQIIQKLRERAREIG